MEKVLFKEKQRAGKNRLLVMFPIKFLLAVVLAAYLIIRINYSGNSLEVHNYSNLSFVIPGLIVLIVILVVFILNSLAVLTTKYYSNRIVISYPSKRKQKCIYAKDIHSYKLRKYNAYKEYWGYGIKNNGHRGKAYIISGKYGVQLLLKDGSRLLIGTQKKQAIKYAMEKLMNEKS